MLFLIIPLCVNADNIDLSKSNLVNTKSIEIDSNELSIIRTSGIHTTNSKKITMDLFQNQGDYRNFFVRINNQWTKMPSKRSFDVIGIRYSNASLYNDTISAVQYYDNTSILYNSGNDHRVSANNGNGYSMNLVDNATSITNELDAIIYASNPSGVLNVCGSYQHATQSLSLVNSKKYGFSSSGLGSVFAFTNGYGSYYDNTQGICLSYTY